jgi:hypothetical protein
MAADDSASSSSTMTSAAPEPIAAPAGDPTPGSSVGGDWRAALPPELQTEKSLERYKDTGALAKAYLEAEKKLGLPHEAPGADAKPEQLAAYRKRMGLPEAPDKYPLTLPQTKEGTDFSWDDRWLSTLKERFHAAHAPPKALQAAIDTFHEYMHSTYDQVRGQQAQQDAQEREEAMRVLEQAWGPRNGPLWKHNNARAVAALEHVFGDAAPAEKNAIIEMAANPHFAAGLARLADGLLERGFVSGDEVGGSLDTGAAQAKIDELRTAADKDPFHPLNNRLHPQHQRVFDEWIKLHGVIAGPDAWKPIPGMVRRS